MDLVPRFFKKLWLLIRRDDFNRDLDEEIAFHREQAEKVLIEDGMSPKEARYAAMRQFGNVTRIKEEAHDTVGFQFETIAKDVRYTLRQLRKNPGFAITAILILALGVGASTAIFSAVYPILFEPLPYPQPSKLTMIWETRDDGSPLAVRSAVTVGSRRGTDSFDGLAVVNPWQPAMTGETEPERFDGQRVTFEYFRTLAVAPALGRDFQAADDLFRGPNVVMLSDKLWRRRFGADASIVGHQVKLDDNLYTVVGVMPASFENVLAPEAEIWAPLQYDPSLPSDGPEWGHHLLMVGRLRPGVSREQARSELNVILHTVAQIYAKGYDSSGGAPKGFLVDSLQSDVTKSVRPALLAVLGAVLLLLVIACVNVTNLLLARAVQRRGEFAMRSALGAGRSRLIRQLLTETLLLAIIGGAFGMIIATFGVRALLALSPPELPRVGAIRVDGTVFAFGLGITTVIGLVFGLIPALHVSRSSLHSGLQQNSLRSAGSHQGTRRTLVVAEVALALMLLVSAGLLLRSMQRLFAVDPGFNATHLLTLQVQETGRRFNPDGPRDAHRVQADAARERFFVEALDAARQVPGVTAAARTSQLPLSGDYETYGVEFEAYPNDRGEPAFRYAVSPEYFKTMGIPLRRGRWLADSDRAGNPVAVLISESFANRQFPGQDPIGKRVRAGPNIGHSDRPWATIVGVVGDVKQASLALSEPDAFYTTTTQWPWVDSVQSMVVRTNGDAALLASAVRSAIWSVDKNQPIVRVATMEKLLTASEAQRHFALLLFGGFALVALLLAATGLYGVLSGSVTERTREIGIRAALGASRSAILALVVRQGMRLSVVGVVIGLVGAVAASRALITLLFGISQLDAVTYIGVILLLLGVSAVACWVPAWRAAQVDPSITLRAE